MQSIVLGSSSQTRAMLLEKFSIPFIQRECGFDEELNSAFGPCSFCLSSFKGGKCKVVNLGI